MFTLGASRVRPVQNPMTIRAISALLAAAIAPIWAQSYIYNQSPSREFGQTSLTVSSGAPNLVEGRELYLPLSVAVDTSVNPPIVYVADFGNNRILAWKNANSFTKGDFANLAIGQTDLVSTLVGGPSNGTAWGLRSPLAVAVDGTGNLWVMDGLNQRILRYPQPFNQQRDYPIPDLVIGQKTLTSADGANQTSSQPSSKSLSLGAVRAGMTFDKAGNLWVTDTGNNRVLRYSKASIDANSNNMAADLVLGQATFDVATLPAAYNRLTKTVLVSPAGIAVTDAGDVYVSDALNRVLYFQGPFVNGKAASRLLGVDAGTTASPNPVTLSGCPTVSPQPCSSVLGSVDSKTNRATPPSGLATLGNNVFVADTGNNRIVKFGTPDTWTAECTLDVNSRCATGTFSPVPLAYVGQADGISVQSNRGSVDASASSLAGPVGLTFNKANSDLYIADSNNHRVLVYPASSGVYVTATRLLGQTDWIYSSPNLVEGRELYIFGDPGQTGAAQIAGAMVVDTKNNRLYIADTFNNRILGFNDARKVKPGSFADFVIGQRDLQHTKANYETNDPNAPTDGTLNRPVGLVLDAAGNLYVADSGNSRVLRFPAPFDQIQQKGQARADLVIGQSDFFSRLPNAQATGMSEPWGLALTRDGNLLVSDNTYNRVLLFMLPFRNGMAASKVFGQADFRSSLAAGDSAHLSSPAGITTDSSDRLYVADSGNNRLSVFTDVLDLSSTGGQQAVFTASTSSPLSVAINSRGEIWITDPTNNRVLRFPEFLTWRLAYDPTAPAKQLISTIPVNIPSAVALDASDNIIVAEGINRVSIFYLQAAYSNTANYSQAGMSPGSLVNIYRFLGPTLAPDGTLAVASGVPFPTTLGDIQVTVNGKLAPLYRVQSSAVVIQVPKDTPANSGADIQILRASTGEVLAAGLLRVNPVDPGFYTNDSTGSGQIAAINDDGTRNGTDNPVGRNKVISLYGNGLGLVPNQPEDGQAATTALKTGNPVQIYLSPGPGLVPDANIQYVGLAPGSVGEFQVNLLIPDSVPVLNGSKQVVSVVMVIKDAPTNNGPLGRLITTIVVK